MDTPRKVFQSQDQGILNIIRAADIYTIHLLAKMRGADPDKELIMNILQGNKVSGYNLMSVSYQEKEFLQLQKDGHLREIGQQILVATHTALETYMISKFEEYYYYLMKDADEKIVKASLGKIRFRSLIDLKKNYMDFLDIHLPSFDVEYFTSDKCVFKPKDSWAAINLIDTARHEIVHQGYSNTYVISTLMDSWYPFEFCRRWVTLFDANFDSLIYKKHITRPLKEYQKRRDAALK